jgi:hypothetical protein
LLLDKQEKEIGKRTEKKTKEEEVDGDEQKYETRKMEVLWYQMKEKRKKEKKSTYSSSSDRRYTSLERIAPPSLL